MKICVVVDENNIIIGYAVLGSIEEGIEIEVDEIPEDLWTGKYKLINNEIIASA